MGLVNYLNLLTAFIFSLILAGFVAFLRLKKKKTRIYLIFFTIFYIYIIKVLDYTLFQFQSLVLLRHFMPNLILNGQMAGKEINFIPLIGLTPQDMQTSVLNILLLVPFGFGLPFITDLRIRKVVIIGACFSIFLEFAQFLTGSLVKITFRIADINDVIFNTIGVAIGFVLFIGFMRFYRRNFPNGERTANAILRYIAQRPQIY